MYQRKDENGMPEAVLTLSAGCFCRHYIFNQHYFDGLQ